MFARNYLLRPFIFFLERHSLCPAGLKLAASRPFSLFSPSFFLFLLARRLVVLSARRLVAGGLVASQIVLTETVFTAVLDARQTSWKISAGQLCSWPANERPVYKGMKGNPSIHCTGKVILYMKEL